MSHVYRLGFACLVVIPIGCDVPPLNWPSFDEKVIEVGRRALQAQADEVNPAHSPKDNEPGAERTVQRAPISSTREAVLTNVKVWVDVRGKRGQRAVDAIRELGPNAVDPLLEILADDSLPRRYTDRAVVLLIPLGRERKDKPDGSQATVLSLSAHNIFDAVVDYAQRHPDARPGLGNLSRITPLDRIPRVIELIESSSGDRQRSSIWLFNALTYTSFPTTRQAFCGNSSPASIRRAIKEGEQRQRDSVGAIKVWWAEHKNESREVWLTASLRRSIQARTEYLKADIFTNVDDKQQLWQKNHAIREYYPPHFGLWRSSVFGMLVEEFGKAPEYVKPYVLRMIGSTGHLDAATFIAPKLKSTNSNLQHAAIAALKDLKVAGHNETIGRILRSTKDQGLALEAIDALMELAKSEAIEDFTYALDHPESPVPSGAERALKPYLVSHADRLREIAQTHPSEEVRRVLGVMLDSVAAAFGKVDTRAPSIEERITSTRALLRSDDPDRQKRGISMASGYPELLPDVLELIRSTDYLVRFTAVELIQKIGIPRLTVENAPRLMGYSSELDRHVAAYCYAKYGRKAVPVMRKAAFSLDDPMHPKSAPGHPAVGLIRALVKERTPGIEQDVIRLVKDSRSNSRYVELLELLDDSKSASLVGEFLDHDERHYRLAAIRVIRARYLTQHADRLFELASLRFDQNEVDRLRAEAKEDKLTKENCGRQVRRVFDRPHDQHAATLALIDLDDPRAWQAVVTCLQDGHLVWRERSQVGPQIVINFGVALSRLKTSHREDIHALLREELQGENRERFVVSMITALSENPVVADSDALWSVAMSPQAHEQARTLAAIALSKLGERRVIAVLHELIRSYIAPDPERKILGPYPPGFSLLLTPSMKWRILNRRTSLLDFDSRRRSYLSQLEHHHVDMGLALRRLDDESLVNELVEALSDNRGDFNTLAYRFLGGIVGIRAYDHARKWIRSQEVESSQFLPVMASALIDLEVPIEEVLPLMVEVDEILLTNLHVLVACDAKEVADVLEKAYHKLTGRRKRYQPQILNALCRFGDLRGIALAAQNPLLLASVVRYLPDAPGMDFPAGHFDYNRIEEAMRVQAWYEQHASDLRWDSQSSQFRLPSHAP